jgi:hypothetical protein
MLRLRDILVHWGELMTKSSLCLWVFGSLFALCLAGESAHAQSTRTWVSGATGSDSNPCSITQPCMTFAGAYGKTAIGGEISVLSPGGYGALTITHAISIYNDGVGEAGILVSGTNGIVIQAGASDVVNLRGLIFEGLNASVNGVLINTAARVSIQNCVIQGFSNGSTGGLAGVNIAPTSGTIDVKIQDTTIIHNNAGIFIKPSNGATANVSIDHTRIDNNLGAGVRSDGTGGGTIFTGISDSSMSLNAANGVIAVTGPGSATVSMMRDVVHANTQYGVQSNQTSGGTATVLVGESMISSNGSGAVEITGGGTLQTYQTNQVVGSGGTGFSGVVGLQ